MKRVVIVGAGGSGKSTLARRLGDVTGLPVVHLDHVAYRPGWVLVPKDVERALERLRRATREELGLIGGLPGCVSLLSVSRVRAEEGPRAVELAVTFALSVPAPLIHALASLLHGEA